VTTRHFLAIESALKREKMARAIDGGQLNGAPP